MVDLDVASISAIPRVAEVSRLPKGTYTLLPVVVLSYSVLEKTAIMLVTDFTSHPDLGFAMDCLPKFLPQDFRIGNRAVAKSEILAVGVYKQRAHRVWEELKKFSPQLQGSNQADKADWDILSLCVFALIYFRPQVYKNGLEGYLSEIAVWDLGPKPAGPIPPAFSNKAFDSLMQRLTERMTPGLFSYLSRHFPIGKHISAKDSMLDQRPNVDLLAISSPDATMSSQEHTLHTSVVLESKKRRRLDPRIAVYQQQLTQAAERHPKRNDSILGDSSQEPADPMPFSANNRYRDGLPGPKENSILPTHGPVDFLELSNMDCANIADGICLDVMANIDDIQPSADLVFVKSYGRTMRIAPLTVILEKAGSRVHVYISSAEEICRFFGILEVEVAMSHMLFFKANLNSLRKKEVEVRIEKKTMLLSNGVSLACWGMASSLKILVQRAWPGP